MATTTTDRDDATMAATLPVPGALDLPVPKVDTARPSTTDVVRWRRALSRRLKQFLILADGLAAGLATLLLPPLVGETGPEPRISTAVVAGVCFVIAGSMTRLYRARHTELAGEELRRIAWATVGLGATVVIAGWGAAVRVERSWLVVTMIAVAATVTIERQIVRRLFEAVRRRHYLLRRLAIIGDNDEARALRQHIESEPAAGYRLVSAIPSVDPADGGIDGAIATIAGAGAESVLIAATAMDADETTRLTRRLVDAGLHVEVTSTMRDVNVRRLHVRPIGPFPVMYVEPVPRDGWRASAKRAFDLSVAGLGLLVLSPLLVVVALAVKLTSKGPVFYGQNRVGRDGRHFKIWKFRTMVDGADNMVDDLATLNEADGPLFKISHDPRITRVGRLLRRTSIDELPQLWNVVRDDMSLVGPRPALPDESSQWSSELHERLKVKPGITGMWQVSGRSDASFEEYARLDLYYVHNWSLVVDLQILARTLPAVIRSDGAY